MRTKNRAIPCRDGCPIQFTPSPSRPKNLREERPRGIPAYIRMTAVSPGCSAFSGFVVRFHSYYYFTPSVSFFQISDSLRDFTQPVALVDDRCYLSSRHELPQNGQLLFASSPHKLHELLATEP